MLTKRLFLIWLLIIPFSISIVHAQSSTAYISGTVVDATNVTISVNGNVIGMTDATGYFMLPVAVNGDNLLADIVVSAPGRGTWTMTQTALSPNVTRLLDPITLGTTNRTVSGGIIPGSVQRTAADLAAIASLGTPTRRAPYLPFGQRSDVSEFDIPMTIVVGITPYLHCSDWINAGMPITEVIVMDFKEYVKNVLPNEWINSWHPQSLQTGAIAAKAFAWWRITLHDPRPDGVDVVNNTCDQVFIENSRRDTTDAAIDATWHLRMHRDDNIIEIHYLAYDWQCEDLGWAMCMGQWDTQYKALDGWLWQDILAFYYSPIAINVTNTIAPNANIVANGGFDGGMTSWQTWGGIGGVGVVNGVLEFYRQTDSTDNAVVFQDFNYRIPQETPMRFVALLGNSSAVEKVVSVHIHSVDHWDGVTSCQFTIPPNMPLQKYIVYANNPEGWVGMRAEINGETADSLPAYQVDKVKLVYKTKGQPDDVPVCDAPRPGKPTITAPIASATYGKNVLIALTPGESNGRPGYSPAYHVQVSTDAAFENLVYDNAADLLETTTLTVTLQDGIHYLRVRQFDGIDRWSRWSKVVPFTVLILPGKPTLIAPIGSVEATDLAFSWTLAEDATLYKLSVKDLLGNKIGNAKFTPEEAGCAVTSPCTVTAFDMQLILVTGTSYNWKVVAKNANGKNKSDPATFTLIAPAASLGTR